MTPVLFLDIDGVLTNEATRYRTGHPACVAHLNTITERTGAVIVVSSVWRTRHDVFGTLRKWGVKGHLLDCTPVLDEQVGSIWVWTERGMEIQAWLDEHPGYGPICILDDNDDMEHLLPRLVQTDTERGLQEADAALAIAMLLEVRA